MVILRSALLCVVLLGGWGIAACATTPDGSYLARLKAATAKFDLSDPAGDARKSALRNDLRLLGLDGYASCQLPGQMSAQLQALSKDLGRRCISGTADVIESAEFGAYQNKVSEYAVQYNETIAMLVVARATSR